MESMLLGRYDGVVGEKNRATFPKKFQDILGDRLIITKGLENCLTVTTEANWQELLAGIDDKPFTSSDRRELQRFLFGNAAPIELDRLRRFIIPEYLLAYANITSEIVYIGINERVEVWDKTEWEKRQQNVSPNVAAIADRLEQNQE